ncbi:ABC transporter substrate-binding protein [Cryobacterium sp.]|uniref:ABC transporter substrate-binding protein n=1 Tax=Cryobacterium sp. TaxID=1926290 RepID=UPI00261D1752|nr:ABC transporter substrate-binding protein [Cryobacterium sp.]MCU1445515.1 transporter substrate-binding protein [Cryobacterium sp.]
MSRSTAPSSRWVAAPVAALATVGLLTACSTPLASAEDTVIFAIKEDPTCLDPQQTSMTTALNIGRQVVDSLTDQDAETGEIVPWLAESFETNDDLTAFTFTLRDDVTFSDDTPLTATVVKANFDALAALGPAASLASQYLAGYDSTVVTDDATLTVNFSTPNAQFLQGTSTMTLGLVAEASAAATAEERCQSVIGSGPFVYDSYVPNDSVVIVKRAGYDWASTLREHSGEALVSTIEFPIITENGVRTGGLDSGEFDIIQDLPYADEARFDTDDFNLYAKANTGVPNSLIPNTSRPIVSDEAVRQAMLLGTDREEIKTLTGATNSEPPTSALTSSTTGFVSQADAMEYDPDAAMALLEDAGWIEGADGIREKDGVKLSVSVTAFYAQDVLETVQMQLAKIGIDLQLNMVTAGDFFGVIASGDYDFLGAALTRTDPDALRVLFSQAASSHWAIVDDAELEGVLAEQAITADAEARAALVEQGQALIIDKAYLIPTLETTQLHASVANVHGVAFDSASRIVLYDVRIAE